MKVFLFLILCFLNAFTQAQVNYKFDFFATINQQELEIGKSTYSTVLNDSIRIDNLKFYVSNLKLLNQDKVVYEVKNYYLIDYASKKDIKFRTNDSVKFDAISFDLGIDSVTHEMGAMEGDLDPTKGMYWTWQSGYIFFKLEGCSKVVDNSKGVFTFHIGGFNQKYSTLQHIAIKSKEMSSKIIIDLDFLLKNIQWKQLSDIMSPGEKAVEFSKLLPSIFSF
jgi:hypothetical protein